MNFDLSNHVRMFPKGNRVLLLSAVAIAVSISILNVLAAPPLPPCIFYGYVYVGGSPAPDGLNVTAVISGTELNWTTQTRNGTYGWPAKGSTEFWIPSDDPNTPEKDGGVTGNTIEFLVSGIQLTGQTATFESGSAKRRDLSVSEIPPELSPNISNVSAAPSTPQYDDEVVVSAVITDDVAVDRAFLSYSENAAWYNISMTNQGNMFNGTIPKQPYGTLVQYMIYANDTNNNWATTVVHYYTVRDFIPPNVLGIGWTPSCPYPYVYSNVTRANEPTLVAVNVSEPINASGIARVLLSYRADSGKSWNTTMDYNSTSGLWEATMPAQSNTTDTVEFFIEAHDNAGNAATSVQGFSITPVLAGDINADGKIDMRDVGYAARHFGDHYP